MRARGRARPPRTAVAGKWYAPDAIEQGAENGPPVSAQRFQTCLSLAAQRRIQREKPPPLRCPEFFPMLPMNSRSPVAGACWQAMPDGRAWPWFLFGARIVGGSRRPCAHAQGYTQGVARRVNGGTEGASARNRVARFRIACEQACISYLRAAESSLVRNRAIWR
jgi:hypothetical protein